MAWGYYDAKAAPVLRIKSGDTVEIETLITTSPKRLERGGRAARIRWSDRCATLPTR